MAFRPRTPTYRLQPSVRPVYENVQPKSEMKENQEAYLLYIYLPGFTRERIRITYDGMSGMLRVSGETPIEGGTRWSRFDQTYPIPGNCEVDKIQGKFQQGLLTVTMPKKFISQVTPKPEDQVTTNHEKGTTPSGKPVAEVQPKPEQAQDLKPTTTARGEEPIGDKKSASIPKKGPVTGPGPADLEEQKGTQKDTPPAQRLMETQKPVYDKPIKEPGPEKGQVETVQKTFAISPKDQRGKPRSGQEELFEPKKTLTVVPKEKTDEKAQTGQEGTEPSKETDEKRQEEIRQKTILATVKKQLDEKSDVGKRVEDVADKRVTEKVVEDHEKKPSESRKPTKKDMNQKGVFKKKEIMATKVVSPKEAETSAPKADTKKKWEITRRISPKEEKKSKEDMIETMGKGIIELAGSASLAVRKITEGKLNDEDKHLVANIGAAVLVIAALAAYISYKFTSSGRT